MAGAGEDGPISSTRPMVGEYRLLEPLGRGGMGVVHLAEHARTGERVALKTVAVASERYLQSIRREIHTFSLIRHPGIVRIVDEGSSDGVPWYAMELLDGLSLHRWSAARTAREEKETRSLWRNTFVWPWRMGSSPGATMGNGGSPGS